MAALRPPRRARARARCRAAAITSNGDAGADRAPGSTPARRADRRALEIGGVEQVKEAVPRRARHPLGARRRRRTCATGCAALRRRPGLHRWWRCCRWRWASAPTPRSSRWSTACCCARCRSRDRSELVARSTGAAGPTRSGTDPRPPAAVSDGALAWSESARPVERAARREPVDGLWVSGSFFEVLGVQPVAGPPARRRPTIGAAAARTARSRSISYAFWQRRFGGDRRRRRPDDRARPRARSPSSA